MRVPGRGARLLPAAKPADFRKGRDGLAALARNELRKDLFTGTVFVFRAKRADRLKFAFRNEPLPTSSKLAFPPGHGVLMVK